MLGKISKILGFGMLLLVSVIFIVVAYNIVKIKMDPYNYVNEAGDDVAANVNLNRANKVLSKEEMDSLLVQIFSRSMRLDCIDNAFHFAEDHQLYYLRPVIENRLNYFDTFQNDTTWQAIIKRRKNYNVTEVQRMTKGYGESYRDVMKNWK